jgi:nucleotide-binding universal stress UspA family protein
MIPEIRKILFTTDLTEGSHHAFNYAVSVASRHGATITIIYVMEEPSRSYSEKIKDFLGEEKWQQVQQSHEQHARQVLIGKKHEASVIREALDEFSGEAQRNFPEHGFALEEIVVTSGSVVEEILSESQDRDCDLIVMGYHVRGKFEEAVLGSTSRRVLRRSKIPVMLVRLPEEMDSD